MIETLVADASVVVALLVDEHVGAPLAQRLFKGSWHAPHLVDVEVLQSLRRLAASRVVSAERARIAVEDLKAFALHRHAHVDLLERAWELRASISAYDATYVALAEVLGCALLTRDRKLASSHGHRAHIELIP